MTHPDWSIILDADDNAAAAVFAADPLWNGYSLCDLEPPLRSYTQVLLAHSRYDLTSAALLILRHPEFTALVPHGPADGVAAILATHDQRPAAPFILGQPAHRPAIEQFYTFATPPTDMLRMALTAAAFRPVVTIPAAVERLTPDDLPALRRLYESYPANAFTADQLRSGVFFGVREHDRIVAAGGTHALGPRAGIAAVGNIYVQPHVRGRGYGLVITAQIVTELLRGPYHDIILNVATANDPAIRIYTALGFAPHCRYWEGAATVQTH